MKMKMKWMWRSVMASAMVYLWTGTPSVGEIQDQLTTWRPSWNWLDDCEDAQLVSTKPLEAISKLRGQLADLSTKRIAKWEGAEAEVDALAQARDRWSTGSCSSQGNEVAQLLAITESDLHSEAWLHDEQLQAEIAQHKHQLRSQIQRAAAEVLCSWDWPVDAPVPQIADPQSAISR
ncbi:MAG: hypothetical protein AAGB04_01425 [Pseudomonadota bacterium]